MKILYRFNIRDSLFQRFGDDRTIERADTSPTSVGDVDQFQRRQGAEGLAHHGAADVQLFGELALAGQCVADVKTLVADVGLHSIHRGLDQRLAGMHLGQNMRHLVSHP